MWVAESIAAGGTGVSQELCREVGYRTERLLQASPYQNKKSSDAVLLLNNLYSSLELWEAPAALSG